MKNNPTYQISSNFLTFEYDVEEPEKIVVPQSTVKEYVPKNNLLENYRYLINPYDVNTKT